MKKISKLTKFGPIVTVIMAIMRIFKKTPVIIGNTNLPEKAIYISNHSAAVGPITLSLYFPSLFIPWGVHQMTENFRARWNYLFHVFYRKQREYGKTAAFILSTLFAPFSKLVFVAMHVIPTYRDLRLHHTIDISIKHLDSGNSILIFPEDSDDGYKEILDNYQAGFVLLAKGYLQKRNIDLPIIPIYFSKKENIIIIGEVVYCKKMFEQGLNRNKIAEFFLHQTNLLYANYLDSKS